MACRTFTRHTLAYFASEAWGGIVAGQVDPVLLDWADNKWPAIIRRPDCSDTGYTIPLGLPLPPSMGKRRICLRCDHQAILRTAPPPLLQDAASTAPDSWQVTIAALLILSPRARCFGSLAWALLTGMPYLCDTSDLDLIVDVEDAAAADQVAQRLVSIADTAPMAIDAELTTPSGSAVQWREWNSGAGSVMVKSMNGASLVRREALFT
jgi:phosphoribosyl-dephospho-CoA transferase